MIKRDKISILLASLFATLLMPSGVYAQDDRLDDEWQTDYRHGISVDFRVNSTVIDRKYRKNDGVMDRIDSLFNAITNDTLVEVVSIEFCGTASPEGNSRVNSRLSRARLDAMEKMVRGRLDISEDIVLRNDHYIAWDHLIELVEADETLPQRERVLEILRTSYPDAKDWRGVPIDGRIPELKAIDNGAVWYQLNSRYFVQMRNAWFIMTTHRRKLLEPAIEAKPLAMAVNTPKPAQIYMPVLPVKEFDTDIRVPLMSIKANVLEAAALIANLGLEFRITPRLSLDVIGHYSPYDYFNPHRKARVFGIQPEVRYWWGESLVKGHFIGLHVPVSGFNIQLNDDYRYQDPNHALWGIGVSYGYAMPLGKREKWGVEFTVGFGYMDVKYDTYEGVTNGKYINTQRKDYFGPTRLGINFSYRIDRKKNIEKENFLMGF